ncbi:MAG TPA: capsule assembly Wzi family protein [Bryobacteraceae bacterium]|nr:hypothetical protein [Acidobacteriaceae bacterium]
MAAGYIHRTSAEAAARRLSFEVASSEELSQDEGGACLYPQQYRDGNSNKGFRLGDAVGRDGRAMEGRLGWWFSARTRTEAGYRQNKISEQFSTGGGFDLRCLCASQLCARRVI